MQYIIIEKNLIELTHSDETKEMAHDSQIVRAKESLKLSHVRPSYRQASGTSPPIKALSWDTNYISLLTMHMNLRPGLSALLYSRNKVYRGYLVFAFSVIKMFVCLSVCLSVCKHFFRERFLSNYLG